MADLDLDLLASIASGGLGSWVEDAAGRSLYVKSDDCIGGRARAGEGAAKKKQAAPARDSRCCRLGPPSRAATQSAAPLLPPSILTGCLKDLQRFFRNDDDEARPAFFAVSKYNFARSDLVPLITAYPEDPELVYNARE
jgi:hypothetical protein